MPKEAKENLGDLMKAANVDPYYLSHMLKKSGETTAHSTVYNWMNGMSAMKLNIVAWIPLLQALELPVNEEGIQRLVAACTESQRLYQQKNVKKKVPVKRTPKRK